MIAITCSVLFLLFNVSNSSSWNRNNRNKNANAFRATIGCPKYVISIYYPPLNDDGWLPEYKCYIFETSSKHLLAFWRVLVNENQTFQIEDILCFCKTCTAVPTCSILCTKINRCERNASPPKMRVRHPLTYKECNYVHGNWDEKKIKSN